MANLDLTNVALAILALAIFALAYVALVLFALAQKVSGNLALGNLQGEAGEPGANPGLGNQGGPLLGPCTLTTRVRTLISKA